MIIGLAVFSAAMWFAWLGWDHEYYMVDGMEQGPYRAWQVIGCGASVAVAAVVAFLAYNPKSRGMVLAPVAAIGFAVPWTWDASSDVTGLFMVGAIMVVVGGTAGLTVVLAVAATAHDMWRRRAASHLSR